MHETKAWETTTCGASHLLENRVPIAEPVAPLAPWQTAWPAGVALVGWLVAAWYARRQVRTPRTDLLWMTGIALAAMVVRLVVLPAWSVHYFDGHEAEYWDIFRGVRSVNRGGTVLYPSMQWFWWALGRVLPHHRWVPLVAMATLAGAGVALAAHAGRLLAGRVAGLVVGLLLVLHPVHAAWSTSAYNVMVPWFFSAVTLWCAALLASARRPAVSVVWLASWSWTLVAVTRMEAAWIGLPCLGLAALSVVPGVSRWKTVRRRWRWLLPVAVAVLVAVAAIIPLVFPGEVPGAGERALSFCINRGWFAPYTPFDGLLGLGLVGALWMLAVRRAPLLGLLFGASVLGAHLVLASFDDFGDRHTLGALLLMAVCAGVAAGERSLTGRLALGGVALLVLLSGRGLLDMRDRFYGPEERFASVLTADTEWSKLPRWTPERARSDCGWIAEDPRVAPYPQRSHFNLIDPTEAESLRHSDGCLRWCVDVQDWRWSSRGVRDRALRTVRLFDMRPVAVVEEAGSGYACLVMELERRRCCSADAPQSRPVRGGNSTSVPSPAPASSPKEDDASGTLYHSRIP